MSISTLIAKFREADAYRKRGIIYISISLLGMGYELIFVNPFRPTVLILWASVIGIGLIVMTTLKGPKG